MKKVFCLSLVLYFGFAQAQSQRQFSMDRPRLVVGIVVDQMRQEYLYRYYDKFGDGGFKKLMGDGFVITNAHYNYIPTYTGPGHASVYTGTTPAIHGIIGNDWFDKDLKKNVNCVEDPAQKPIGSKGNGDVSPWRLLATTVTDELKLGTQKRAKVVSLSIKDRGAVLPGGHMANGAYWYNASNGEFITSTFYMKELPAWVNEFNKQKLPDTYLSQTWTTLLPIEKYSESSEDNSPYEEVFRGKETPTFPYVLKELKEKNGNYGLLVETPFGNDIVNELAKAAVRGERLGKNSVTDFLAISFSSTDIVGHTFGPNSIEVEDTYLRLDRNIADLLATLDKEVGAGQYTVFLTADHAVADVPQYLMDNNVPAGYFKPDTAVVNSFFRNTFPGREIIEGRSNNQLYLNHGLFQGDPKTAGIDLLVATEAISKFVESLDGVAGVFTKGNLRQGSYDEAGLRGFVIRGYHARRSGDLAFVTEPAWTSSSSPRGTTHGSPFTYDTHVPMLFFGFGIKKGTSAAYHPITDIAPTISVLLKVKFPSGCTGQPIREILDK